MREALIEIARKAGTEILSIYDTADFGVEIKQDASPLTLADLAAHRLIVAELERQFPDIPVLSEESIAIDFKTRSSWDRYFLVDPLDGTKEFIERNGEFTVNIALISRHEPIFGIVHVPVTSTTYVGDVLAGTAWKIVGDSEQVIQTRPVSSAALTVVASRRHGSDALKTVLQALEGAFEGVSLTSMGSSLKLCLVAEGEADFYPRLAPTSEWDTAAAHAVVTAAGGDVCNTDFQPLQYNTKAGLLNPNFLVIGDKAYDFEALLAETLSQVS
jgi:3'(2'), 5'-bisphosphate nucleotidase